MKTPLTALWITVLILTCSLTSLFAAKPFKTEQWETSNGVRVVFYQAMEVPMLDISIAFAAGSAYDENHYGLSALTSRLLNEGNGGLNASTIAERIANTGAQYQNENNQNMVALTLRTLTIPDAIKEASAMFNLIISHPDFPLDGFEREKKQQLIAIKQSLESPEDVANQIFFRTLYAQHPYGHAVDGDEASVKALTIQDVRQFYQRYFVGNNAVLVMVGAIDRQTAEQLANQLTKDLPKGEPAAPIPPAESVTEEMDVAVKFPSSQTVVRIGQLGINHHTPEYFPLQVGNNILGGGGLVSRLAEEVREKRGLTYGISSQFLPMPADGPYFIGLSTQTNQTTTAVNLTRDTLSSFIKTGPTESELKSSKQYLTGSFPLSLASNQNIANMLLKIAFYHLPNDYLDTYIDHINAVTITEIQDAFAKHIKPNKLIQVTVGRS